MEEQLKTSILWDQIVIRRRRAPKRKARRRTVTLQINKQPSTDKCRERAYALKAFGPARTGLEGQSLALSISVMAPSRAAPISSIGIAGRHGL